MVYDRFKQGLSKEEYFVNWSCKQLEELNEELKEYIYEKHLFKKEVLVRDTFTCQNENCKHCHNVKDFPKLTIHHVRHLRNFRNKDGQIIGNPHKPRNAVTVCVGSHNAFNREKGVLKFSKSATNLPPHIRGHTFKLSPGDVKLDWKALKAEAAKIRKMHKGIDNTLDWKMIVILLHWLYKNYDDF